MRLLLGWNKHFVLIGGEKKILSATTHHVSIRACEFSTGSLRLLVGGFEFARMHLYNLTLQTPTASLQAIVGNFSGARQQEIIISHDTRLQLLRPDIQTGKLSTIIATDVFGSIRSLAAFRLTGGTKGKPL